MIEVMNNKYIGIKEGTILYNTKGNINVLVRRKEEKENLYKMFNINETGKKILENINGKERIEDFIKCFCLKYEIDYLESREWIYKFVVQLINKKSLEISDDPIVDSFLKYEGSEDYIAPMHATIEITEKCNLKCKHCYLEADIHKKDIITYDNYENLVKTLVENNVINIELTGGEIFMHPRVYDILKLSFDKFAMVGILTNGTMLSDEVLNLLIENKDRTIVNVSVDHVNSDYHDDFRGMNGAWKLSCDNIKKMSQNGIVVRVASSITRDNMWCLGELAELALSLGARVFSFNFVEEFGRGVNYKGTEMEKLDIIKYNDYVNNIIKKYKELIPIIKQEDRIKTIETENCGSGSRSIVIGANGDLRPCALSPKVKILGNVFEEKFSDIFKKDIIKKISNILPPHINNGCDNQCKYLLHCHGCYIKGFERNKIENMCCSWIKNNKLEDIFDLFKR